MSTTTSSSASLPSPPFIQVEGLPNLRDLGGYPVSTPKSSIRRGVIYRAGAPSNQINSEGRSTIKSLGITHVYDLRSNPEIEKAEAAGRGGVVEFEGCRRVFAPVFTDVDYSPQNLMVRFKNYQSGSPEVGHIGREREEQRAGGEKPIPVEENSLTFLRLGIYSSIQRYPQERPYVLQANPPAHRASPHVAAAPALHSR
ncbi:hypothetical protein V493_04865 [Pseudogymnoascus sp. VKM F-4281 (FW-2241)]|nr:hypothetical protein V493_04865 [Pseudogymnoascus sp. VKM F-4281 (FW-2241)]